MQAEENPLVLWNSEEVYFIIDGLLSRNPQEWVYLEDEFRVELFRKREISNELCNQLLDFIDGFFQTVLNQHL